MTGPGDIPSGSINPSKPNLTFYCRDCERIFLSEPDVAGHEHATCPRCQAICQTTQFEAEERERLRNEREVFSLAAHFLGVFAPHAGFKELANSLPHDGEKRQIASDAVDLSSWTQMGQLVRVHYHQEVWKHFETDEQIWRNYLAVAGAGAAGDLLNETEQLLGMAESEAFELVNRLCGGKNRTFITPSDELVLWLRELKAFLETALGRDG